MDFQIKKATKKRARLRMAIEGPAGGGKTMSAIKLAKYLIGEPFRCDNSKIVVVDTERSSSELYADEFEFNHIEMNPENCSPKNMTEALKASERAGMQVVILDSISHEWKWCLAEVDKIKPKFGGNQWAAWGVVKPPHEVFIDAIMASSAHVIVTMRSKMATVQEENERGKKEVKKLGMEAIQSDDLDYAFTVVMAMDKDHNGVIRKTRCRAIDNRVFSFPGEELAVELTNWLNSGDAPVEPQPRIHRAASAQPNGQLQTQPQRPPSNPPQVAAPIASTPATDNLRSCETIPAVDVMLGGMLEMAPAEEHRDLVLTAILRRLELAEHADLRGEVQKINAAKQATSNAPPLLSEADEKAFVLPAYKVRKAYLDSVSQASSAAA